MTLFPLAWSRACELLPASMNSLEARIVIAAAGYQESDFEHWRQIGGPANSFWMFEKAGGVRGVMRHSHTFKHAVAVADACRVAWAEETIYQALPYNDTLSCAFARLLLYSLPDPLPAIGDVDEAWRQYVEAWRPGKPHRDRWEEAYRKAGEG